MEAQVVAEFSSLNALNQHNGPAYSSRCHEGAAPHTRRGRVSDDFVQNEHIFHGESAYTTASSEGRANEHFIEDNPSGQARGISQVFPDTSTAEERVRLLHRVEMCAKAREESTKIMTMRFAQRDAVKSEVKRERQMMADKLMQSQRERDERWSRKLQRSPFAVDLVAENQRIDEENRVRDHVEQRRQRLLQKQSREAHNSIFKRITAENDELERLRREKRLLLENERQLKALRDVERSNARTAQILQERRQQQLRREPDLLNLTGQSAEFDDGRARTSRESRDRVARGEAVMGFGSQQGWTTPR